MRSNQASLTAEVVAAMRVSESVRRGALFDDRGARRFLRWSYAWAGHLGPVLDRLERLPRSGMHNYIATRHAWLDRRVREDAHPQVLILGAGYDTRASRLGGDARYWEVDHPATAARKRRLAPDHPATQVTVDFERQRLDTRLLDAGFDRSLPTTVVWEGVSMYLTEPAFSQTAAQLRHLLPSGSTLNLDAMRPFDRRTLRGLSSHLSRQFMPLLGEALRFFPEPSTMTALLEAEGWHTETQWDATRLGDHYGRFVYPPAYVTGCRIRV